MSTGTGRSVLQVVLVWLLRGYRAVVSPWYGQVCRYHPSCSAYALGAVEQHGGVRGAWLAARRLARCHPWTSGGVDLVPAVEAYRWWGRCPGTDPYAEDAPMPADDPRPSPPGADHPEPVMSDMSPRRADRDVEGA